MRGRDASLSGEKTATSAAEENLISWRRYDRFLNILRNFTVVLSSVVNQCLHSLLAKKNRNFRSRMVQLI